MEKREAPDQEAGGREISNHDEAGPRSNSSSRVRDLPVTRAVAYPPAGHRGRYLAVVTACPHCNGCHLHFGDRWWDLAAVVKTGSCGRAYFLHLSALAIGGSDA